jgi:hypothetical protein
MTRGRAVSERERDDDEDDRPHTARNRALSIATPR